MTRIAKQTRPHYILAMQLEGKLPPKKVTVKSPGNVHTYGPSDGSIYPPTRHEVHTQAFPLSLARLSKGKNMEIQLKL